MQNGLNRRKVINVDHAAAVQGLEHAGTHDTGFDKAGLNCVYDFAFVAVRKDQFTEGAIGL